MRLVKRWTAWVLALTAVAVLAVPAIANAAEIDWKAGTPAAVGTIVQAESTNFQMEGTFGQLGCERWKSSLEITENGFKGVGTVNTVLSGAGTVPNCRVVTWSEPKLSFRLGAPSNQAFVSITWPEFGCVFTGSAMPVAYVVGASSIHVEGSLTTSGACGSTAKFKGDFALSIGGKPVILR